MVTKTLAQSVGRIPQCLIDVALVDAKTEYTLSLDSSWTRVAPVSSSYVRVDDYRQRLISTTISSTASSAGWRSPATTMATGDPHTGFPLGQSGRSRLEDRLHAF